MKVILAVDGSPCSEAVVQEAISRLWAEDTELMVLAVAHGLDP
jgi:hypothetical protein